jgi:hypothetical protein
MFKMRKDRLKNLIKIVKCLEEVGDDRIWLTEIGKRCKIDRRTVARLIDKYLSMFVDEQTVPPFNIRMIKLKPNTDINGILRYLAVMEKINKKNGIKNKKRHNLSF